MTKPPDIRLVGAPKDAPLARGRGIRKGNGKGTGTGWGGPAKGKGSDAPSFTQDSPTRVTRGGAVPPDVIERARTRAEIDAQRAQAARDKIFGIMEAPTTSPETQLSAAKALLDRIEGLPVARNLNLNVNDVAALSDADLVAEAERLRSEGSRNPEGTAPSPVPPQLPDVVH